MDAKLFDELGKKNSDKQQLIDESLKSLQEFLNNNYPMGVPRPEIGKATGKILHPRTQANRDSLGCGITERFKVGKVIVYSIPGVLNHVRQRKA